MTNSDTQREAYEVIKPKINSLHKKIMSELHSKDLTASQLMDATGILYNTLWRRLSELKDAGLVHNTEKRQKNSRGRSETVVSLTKH